MICRCQFVVNSNGNYDVHLIDPDALVQWDLIEEVVSIKYHIWDEQ